jgi:hypothetical protein
MLGIGALNQPENALSKDVAETYQKACRGMLQHISLLDDLLERLLMIVRMDRLTLGRWCARGPIRDSIATSRTLIF